MNLQDISYANPWINWNTLKSNSDGVLIRSGQGEYEDSMFREHYKNSKAANLLRSLYHFHQPDQRGKPQIKYFLGILKSLTSIPLINFIDIEDISYTVYNPDGSVKEKIKVLPPSKEYHTLSLMEWCQEYKTFTGRELGFYTRADYWDTWVIPSNTKFSYYGIEYTTPDWSKHPLWIASWYNYQLGDPRLPRDWNTWYVHQFEGGTGRTEGILDYYGNMGPVDQNRFNGTRSEMLNFFGIKEEGSMSRIYKTTVANKDKANITWFTAEDKVVDMSKITSNSVMLGMCGQNTGEIKIRSEWETFHIRANRTTLPLFGSVVLDANMGWHKEIKLPNFQNRGLYENETTEELLRAWVKEGFTKDQWNNKTWAPRTFSGFFDLKGIVFVMYTDTYTKKGTDINGMWQAAMLQDQVKGLVSLMQGNYIPTVPLYVLAPAGFYKKYPEIANFAGVKKAILETGMFTEVPMATPFTKMSQILRPDENYGYSYVPENVQFEFNIYSQGRFLVDGFGQTISVGLWNDTPKALGFPVVEDPIIVDPPIEPPISTDIEARLTYLESMVKKIVTHINEDI